MPALNTRQKLLLSATAITTAAAAVGLGSAASWSDSETTSETVQSGSFSLVLDGRLVHDAMMPVVNFAPGDSVTRPLDVRNAGDVDFAGVSMSLAAGMQSSDALLDGSPKGLQVQVMQCDQPWMRAEWASSIAVPVHGWSCDNAHVVRDGAFDTQDVPLPFGALRGRQDGLDVNGYDELGAHGSVAHLLVTVSMPEAVGAFEDVDAFGSDYERYGNQAATIEYRFEAVQRAGNQVEEHNWNSQFQGWVNDANLRPYHQYPV